MSVERQQYTQIPDRLLKDLIYIGYGGPTGVFAAVGEADFLTGLLRLAEGSPDPIWIIDVAIHPLQSGMEAYLAPSHLVPLLQVVVENDGVYPDQNGPDFTAFDLKRPSSLESLQPDVLRQYACGMLQEHYMSHEEWTARKAREQSDK